MPRISSVLTSGSIALMLSTSGTVTAQESAPVQEGGPPPAHVAFADGYVIVEHESTSEEAGPNTPLLPGDRLRTEAGRAEVLFGDGSVLHLDEQTTIDLLSDSLVRLLAGRLAVVAGSGMAGYLQVDAAAGSVRITSAGEYRIALLSRGETADVELSVVRGSAELLTENGSMALAAGQRALAAVGSTPDGPWPYNSALWDAFDRWSQDRLAARRGAVSYRYLPTELRPYAGTLDYYGGWNYEPSYGYVWFPRVAHGWRPYYDGRWKFYRRFGWTWVHGPRWAWPTHHYGRWGLTSAGGWFWIPGRHWGPAFVHWGVAPGYVSWCPIGFNNRPVLALWTYRGPRYHNPWTAWTVIHRSHLGHRRAVHSIALDGRRVVNTHRPAFVTQPTGPAFRGSRSPTRIASGTPGRTGIAVPRGTYSSTVPIVRGGDSSRTRRLGTGADVPGGNAARRGPSLRTEAPDRRPSRRAYPPEQHTFGAPFGEPATGSRRAIERGSAASPSAPRTRWRPEDVIIHRGQPPDGGRGSTPPPAGTMPSYASPRSSQRSAPAEWDGPSRMAVPRGSDGGDRGTRGPSYMTGAPSRGSVGPPPTMHTAPPPPPPPARSAGDGQRGERRAPVGHSGDRAVQRGSGERGSGERGSGDRGSGARGSAGRSSSGRSRR